MGQPEHKRSHIETKKQMFDISAKLVSEHDEMNEKLQSNIA